MVENAKNLMDTFIKWYPNSMINIEINLINNGGDYSFGFGLDMWIRERLTLKAVWISKYFLTFTALESEVHHIINKAHVYSIENIKQL